MYNKSAPIFLFFISFILVHGDSLNGHLKEFAVDIGRNISLPCSLHQTRDVMWIREGREEQQVSRMAILEDGSLFIVSADKNDSGIYACSRENVVNLNEKARMKLTVRTPPPALVNVSVHPSTILALILWEVKGNGGYPIVNFTAQYRLADTNNDWIAIPPNHITPNSRQIDVYKLQPNTSYEFRVWATNQLGKGEISRVIATTLDIYTEQKLARRFLTGAETFDTRVWAVAVGIVMGTLILLGLGTCFLLYQECRIPDISEEQEVIELVPNIILNPGYEAHDPPGMADENSNNETPVRLNNNTVVHPRNNV